MFRKGLKAISGLSLAHAEEEEARKRERTEQVWFRPATSLSMPSAVSKSVSSSASSTPLSTEEVTPEQSKGNLLGGGATMSAELFAEQEYRQPRACSSSTALFGASAASSANGMTDDDDTMLAVNPTSSSSSSSSSFGYSLYGNANPTTTTTSPTTRTRSEPEMTVPCVPAAVTQPQPHALLQTETSGPLALGWMAASNVGGDVSFNVGPMLDYADDKFVADQFVCQPSQQQQQQQYVMQQQQNMAFAVQQHQEQQHFVSGLQLEEQRQDAFDHVYRTQDGHFDGASCFGTLSDVNEHDNSCYDDSDMESFVPRKPSHKRHREETMMDTDSFAGDDSEHGDASSVHSDTMATVNPREEYQLRSQKGTRSGDGWAIIRFRNGFVAVATDGIGLPVPGVFQYKPRDRAAGGTKRMRRADRVGEFVCTLDGCARSVCSKYSLERHLKRSHNLLS